MFVGCWPLGVASVLAASVAGSAVVGVEFADVVSGIGGGASDEVSGVVAGVADGSAFAPGSVVAGASVAAGAAVESFFPGVMVATMPVVAPPPPPSVEWFPPVRISVAETVSASGSRLGAPVRAATRSSLPGPVRSKPSGL